MDSSTTLVQYYLTILGNQYKTGGAEMMYFDCFVIAAWAFAFGWLFGAVYVQNRNNEPANLRSAESQEPADMVEIPEYAISSAAAAD
jgi:hypothetical protein